MNRVFNFSAGPSALPLPVLEQCAAEMTCYGQSGMSVMEMSHRSKPFEEIIGRAESLLRKLMGIPDNYKVLFLQGGASSQFAMVPMNLMKNRKIDLVLTGAWADKACKEASKYGEVNIVGSSKDKTYSYIPRWTPRRSRKTRTISISARTTPSTEPNSPNCPKPETCPWWPTFPPAFCPNPST